MRINQTTNVSTYGCLYTVPSVDELVKLYLGISLINKESISLLAHKHNVVINIRTLNRLCLKLLRLFRSRKHTDVEVVPLFVKTEIAGNEQIQGY